jgi:hypothetical protein
MSFQTLVVINHNHIHQARNNPELGNELYNAVCRASTISPTDFGRGMGLVYRPSHADQCSLLVFGNLQVQELTATYGYPNNQELQLRLLRLAADRLGYRLHRKPEPK